MSISRLVDAEALAAYPADRLLDVLRAVTMILTLPSAAAQRAEGLAVLTGQGETWRLTHAIADWEANPGRRHLLIATTNEAERTSAPVTLDTLRALGLRRTAGVRIQPVPAAHTAVQAEWLAGQVDAHGITALALAVSPYHLPRAYLTVLRACERRGLHVPLLPAPTAVPPATPVPESGATAWDLVPGEVRRILEYTDRGWIAAPDELRRYLDRLWTTWTQT
ncbi:hypothetical protein ACQP00_24790 [Dactylosporangium sp. CS-047395]|uniref:hypothetical protein n=1 Tax=Dactylosporangium sp. CS-047395 TaxID=3239936 RepID=UPI003D91DB76